MRGLTTYLRFLLGVTGILVWPPRHSLADTNWFLEPSIGVTVASRLNDIDQTTEQANILGLNARYDTGGFRLLFTGRYLYDSAYDTNNDFSTAAKDKYRHRGEIDQAYFGWGWTGWDFSLGYQKIAWGEADDIRVVDVVNPLDLQNFVLFDLDEIRVAQNMLRAEGALNDAWELECLWIFRSKANDYSPPGSEFAAPLLPEAMEDKAGESEMGIRASSTFNDADISLYGFYGREDMPFFLLEKDRLTARCERFFMLGSSFNVPADKWVVRGDAAAFPSRSLGTDSGGKTIHHMVSGLIGVDYLYRDWTFSAQVADRYIHEWNNDLVENRGDTLITSAAEMIGLSGTLTTRVAATWSVASNGGVLTQFKLTYQANKHWNFRFTIDLMNGDDQNFIGQFANKDRVWSSLMYLF